jgi:uncharacterized protein YoxC
VLIPLVIALAVIAAVTFLVLVVIVFRRMAQLAAAMDVLTREVLPMAQRLQAEAEEVRERLDRLDDRAEALREAAERRAQRRAQGTAGLRRPGR